MKYSKKVSALTFTTAVSLLCSSMSYSNSETYLDNNTTENVIEISNFKKEELEALKSEIMQVKILENNKLKEKQEENSTNSTIDKYIKEYASYFHLEENEVLNIARTFTNNYTENMEMFNSSSLEGMAISFVYFLYNGNLNSYGYFRSEFLKEEDSTFIDENHILENNYSFDEFVSHVASSIGEDEYLALAISNYETGYQSSNQAMNKNNFGGLKNNDGFFCLPTPEAGIVYLVMTVKNILKEYEVSNLEELSGAYVYGNKDEIDEIWVKSVNYIYNQLQEENVSLLQTSCFSKVLK